MRHVMAVWVAFASAALSAAAGPAFDPAEAAKAIAPFLDEQTVGIARIDATRLNVDGIFAKATDVVARLGLQEASRQDLLKLLAGVKQLFGAWVEDFKKAGGRDVYLVVSLADLPGVPLFAVVPVYNDADAQAMIDFFSGKKGQSQTPSGPGSGRTRDNRPWPLPGGRPKTCVQMGRAVFAGSTETLRRIREGKPVPRPEVAKAFAAAGDVAAQALILPTADSRRVISEMMPTLPEELGGGPSTAITNGFVWAAFGADPPPKLSLRMTIQSQDAASAKAMKTVIDRITGMVLAQMQKEQPPAEVVSISKKLLGALTPAVSGDRLVTSLGPQRIDALISEIAPPLGRALRMAATQRNRAAKLHLIGRAVARYVSEHDNNFPEDLQALVTSKMLRPEDLVNPADPQRKPGYVYVRPSVPADKVDPMAVLAYEAYDIWKGELWVCFVDGHVRCVRDEAGLKRLLAPAGTGKKPK